jgi:hypothetical protein
MAGMNLETKMGRRSARGSLRPLLMMLALFLGACGGTLNQEQGTGSVGASVDPVVIDFPVAFVERPILIDEDTGDPLVEADPREPALFRPGGDLFVLDRASPSATARNITEAITLGEGDVRDVSVSYDGRKLVFSLRLPEIPNADEDEQPTWNIWEYDLDTEELRRVIVSDIVAEEGDDLFPSYLPDGRIVFSSTRQRTTGAQLIDDGRPRYPTLIPGEEVPALQLHVTDLTGATIDQITFGEGHDLSPTVLDDGWIAFSRHIVTGEEAIRLYRVRPDGSGLQLLYGANSHDTGSGATPIQFLKPRALEDGRVLVIVRPFDETSGGGDLVAIDVANYSDLDTPIPDSAGLGAGGQVRLTTQAVTTEPGPSPGGRFVSAWPLDDGSGRLLTAWTQCRLQRDDGAILPCTEQGIAAGYEEAPPLTGLWVFDPLEDTQLPVRIPADGFVIDDVAVARNRAFGDAPDTADIDPALVDANLGVLHVHSVYDVDGVDTANPDLATLANPTVTPLGARDPATTPFMVRIVKQVPLPDEDLVDLPNEALGPNRNLGMREIIGYAQIQPDGSVRVQVPANVLLGIEVLNLFGERIAARHDFWLSVAPGETRECGGCHVRGSGYPHGRIEAEQPVNTGLADASFLFPGADPAIFAGDADQTMAETLAEAARRDDPLCGSTPQTCAPLLPSLDVRFEAAWTPDDVTPVPPTVLYRYLDLPGQVPAPLAITSGESCLTEWSRGCRAAIHYEAHIQPIWERSRLDTDGNDQACVGCHTSEGNTVVPAGQLELTAGIPFETNQEPMTSYTELFRRDVVQELDGGALVDVVEILTDPVTGDPLCQLDAEGNPIIIDPDTMECLPQTRNPQTGPYLSGNGARASRFLRDPETGALANLFVRAADTADLCQADLLTPAELRLIREWVDIGAQYYNDPFIVPVD